MSCIHTPLLVLPALPETAEFCGRWLLKAAEANKYLLPYLENSEFWKKLSAQLDGLWLATPSNAALALQSRLVSGDGQLDLCAECPEFTPGFCILTALGFFTLQKDEAEMAMPHAIVEADVVRVFSRLAFIEDEQWSAPQLAVGQLAGR